MRVAVRVLICKLGASMALSELEAVACYGSDRIVVYLYEGTVKNLSLIVISHRKRYLREHLLYYALRDDKASVAYEIGNSGEVGRGKSYHLVRGLSADDRSDKLLVDCESDLLAVHNAKRLVELLRVYDIGALLDDLCFNAYSHALFKIEGREDAGIRHSCLYENSVCC